MPEKAAKDRRQALVLGASLADLDGLAIKQAFDDAPASLVKQIKSPLGLLEEAQVHPPRSILADCLAH